MDRENDEKKTEKWHFRQNHNSRETLKKYDKINLLQIALVISKLISEVRLGYEISIYNVLFLSNFNKFRC